MSDGRIRVAVIGTGNIGTDLAERILMDPDFELVAVVGRRKNSPGLSRFAGRGPLTIAEGIDGLSSLWLELDGVFDATSASAHAEHWPEIRKQSKWAVDLTPSRIGKSFVPVLAEKLSSMHLLESPAANYSMVTCGGQSSAPLIHAIGGHFESIEEIEVSSSIAALSAGPATRENIDEYIEATETLATKIAGCPTTKSILVLNPATPPVMMRTTVTVRGGGFDLELIREQATALTRATQSYVPGYELIVAPHVTTSGDVSATVIVKGAGYYLPEYSGNLDIINAAAVETARRHYFRHSRGV